MMGRCNGSGPHGRGAYVLARLLLAAAAFCAQALAASAEFKLRYRGTSGHLIIFVHGLWGDPLEAFAAKGENTATRQKSWLEMMHEDETPFGSAPALSTYSTATLGYPAGKSDRYSPTDITAKLMHELSVQPELEKHEAIYFVAHSFGGLVVEQLLVNAHLSPGSRLAERTRAVFLAATPSRGAPLAEVASLLPAPVAAAAAGQAEPAATKGCEDGFNGRRQGRDDGRAWKGAGGAAAACGSLDARSGAKAGGGRSDRTGATGTPGYDAHGEAGCRQGGPKVAVPASPPAPAPNPSPPGMPILRLVDLEPDLETLVRLNWNRLRWKATLLAKSGEASAATHELYVSRSKGDKQDPARCGNWVWKRAWTLTFELVPLSGTPSPRRGEVTEASCHGMEDFPAGL